jgi:hypothetical protein
MSFDRAVRRSGVLQDDAGEANFNVAPGFSLPVETIVLRFQLALAKLFLAEYRILAYRPAIRYDSWK